MTEYGYQQLFPAETAPHARRALDAIFATAQRVGLHQAVQTRAALVAQLHAAGQEVPVKLTMQSFIDFMRQQFGADVGNTIIYTIDDAQGVHHGIDEVMAADIAVVDEWMDGGRVTSIDPVSEEISEHLRDKLADLHNIPRLLEAEKSNKRVKIIQKGLEILKDIESNFPDASRELINNERNAFARILISPEYILLDTSSLPSQKEYQQLISNFISTNPDGIRQVMQNIRTAVEKLHESQKQQFNLGDVNERSYTCSFEAAILHSGEYITDGVSFTAGHSVPDGEVAKYLKTHGIKLLERVPVTAELEVSF